jgi:xanthine dehydrogenase YagS FAD-binding subunit
MRPFTYERAKDARAAAEAVANKEGARFISGGTNLLDLMKLDIEKPTHLVDVTHLPHNKIEEANGGLRIGAQVSNSDLAVDARVRERYPLLTKALMAGASPQIRNKASTAGNLLQRTRCYYFYDVSKPCNKREPGSGCSALQGFNRMHAVLGASDQCIAVFPSDMAVAMTALDAEIETVKPDGSERRIPISEFHRLPGDTPAQDNNLEKGELITAVTLPPPPPGKQEYRKVRDRASYAFALVSVAAIAEVQGNNFVGPRIVFGGLAHKPWQAADAEKALLNRANGKDFNDIGEAALKDARGYGHNDFKIPLAKRTLAAVLSKMSNGK